MKTPPATEPTVSVPGLDHVRAAFATLTAAHVDTDTARDWIADMVEQVAKEVRDAHVSTPVRRAPARTDEAGPDLSRGPSRDEWAMIDRSLRLSLAVVNGRRRHMSDLDDRHLATAAGRTTINAAATHRLQAALPHPVRTRRTHVDVIESKSRTTFYIAAVIEWGKRCRALSVTIVRDRHGTYRTAGFYIL